MTTEDAAGRTHLTKRASVFGQSDRLDGVGAADERRRVQVDNVDTDGRVVLLRLRSHGAARLLRLQRRDLASSQCRGVRRGASWSGLVANVAIGIEKRSVRANLLSTIRHAVRCSNAVSARLGDRSRFVSDTSSDF